MHTFCSQGRPQARSCPEYRVAGLCPPACSGRLSKPQLNGRLLETCSAVPPLPHASRAFQVSMPLCENGHLVTDSSRVFFCASEGDGVVNEKAPGPEGEPGGWDRGPAQTALEWGSERAPGEGTGSGQAGHLPPDLVRLLFLLNRDYGA